MDIEKGDHHENGAHTESIAGLVANPPASDDVNMARLDTNLSDCTADSGNGEIEQNLSITDSTRSGLGPQNGDLNTEIESLMASNQDLVQEIRSSRDLNAEKEQKRELLQKQLQRSSERTEALIAEIAALEEEKQKAEDVAVREVEVLLAEKRAMEVENRKAAAENKSMDATLTDLTDKFSLLGNRLDEKWVAMADAQTRVHMLCFEIEKFQLEEEEYLKEVSLLNASNSNTAAQVNRLQGLEKDLSNEIENILTAKASAEQKASDAKAAIAMLHAEISKVTESDGNLQNQLNESRERIQYLEEQDHLMAARERDLETQILDLESKLHALRVNHHTTLQAFEQEKEAKACLSRTLQVTHTQSNGLQRDLDSLTLAFDMQESCANSNHQRIWDLECRVTELLEQKQALVIANADLEAVLGRLRSASQEEQEAKKLGQLKGDIRRLGEALDEAKEKARSSAEKESQLKSKVQELTVLANRKPMLAGLASPLILSSSTIVVVGLLVFLLHSKSR